MGLRLRQVTSKLWSMESPSKPEALKVEEPKDAKFWREEANRLQKEVDKLRDVDDGTKLLVDEIVNMAPRSYDPAPEIPKAEKRGGGSAQSAVLMLSDTHIGQVVKPEQTLGMGGYNFEMFLRRLARLERSVRSILLDHTTTEVPEICVAALGDFLHGALSHSVEAGQVNTLFTQWFSASHALAQFFRNLSQIAPVRVYGAVGNHTRWGTQKKMPTDNTFSNLDLFLLSHVAALVRDCPTIKFNLDEQPFCRFAVQGHQFLGTHGTHMRGGDRMLGIPTHALGRNNFVQTQLALRSGQPIPQYLLLGHLHRPIQLPTTLGSILVNGGWAGIDGFGLMEAFNSSYPSQRFFLVHPKFGISASYELRLDLGDPVPHHYSLPEQFICK